MSDWSGFEVIDDTPPVAKSEGATWNDFEVESEDSQGWEAFEVQEPERERVEFGGGATMVMDPVAEQTPLAPPSEDSGGVLDTAGDFGLSIGKGSVGILSDIGGLIGDLGNRNEDLNVTAARERYGMPGAGQAIRDSGKEGKKYLTSLMSEAGQFSDKKVAQQIEQLGEEGFVAQVFGSVGIYLDEPRALLNGIGESLPSMIPSTTAARATAATMLAAKGLVPGSKAAATYLATKPAMARLASAAAVGEGTASGLSTYSTGRDAGKSIEEAGGYALAAGAGTAAIGRFASKWIPDVEAELGRALAGGKAAAEGIKGAARNIMMGAISEGALQEFPQSIQEQIWANLAEDKPWDEGLGTAGGSGFVMGMGMGAGTQTMAEAVSLATGVPTTDSLNEALNNPANAGPVAAGMTARLDDGFGTVDDVTVVEELSDTTVRIRRSDGSEQLAGRDLLTPTGPAPTAPAPTAPAAGPGSPADITEDPFSSNLAAQNAARQAEIDAIMGEMELPDTGTSNLTEQIAAVPAPRFAVSPAERAATPQLGARAVGTDGNPIADTPQQREINERRAPSASAFVQAERDAEAQRAADEADFEFQTLRERVLGRVEQEQEKGPVTIREMAAKVRAKKEAAAEPDIEPDTEATGANAPANPAMAEAMKAAQDTKRNETVRQAVGRRQGGLGDQVQATGEPVRRQAGFGEDLPALEDTPLGEGSVPGFARFRADEKNVGQETPDVDFSPQQGEAPIFKTKLEGLVNERLGKQVPAAQLSQMIKAWTKKGEVKPEEIDTLKIQEWADSQEGKVTKQQVLDFIAENAPQMNESLKGTDDNTPSIEDLREAYVDYLVTERYSLSKEDGQWVVTDDIPGVGLTIVAELSQEEAESYADPTDADNFLREFADFEANDLGEESIREQMDFDGDNPNPTRYGSYTQPGGSEYKELLITRGGKVLADYTSGHWDEKNVLAHVRFDTRQQEGKKTLFIEEVQSDMHQDGRKKGYRNQTPSDELVGLKAVAAEKKAAYDAVNTPFRAKLRDAEEDFEAFNALLSGEEYAEIQRLARERDTADLAVINASRDGGQGNRVPDAPFKKSWPMLAMKRMIRYAAENGFERISWATGAMNADLYSLRESVRSIEYNKTGDGEWTVTAKGVRSADPVIEKKGQSESDLEGLLGKEIASKIVNDEGTREAGEPEGYGVLSGEGLDVGGEGMSAFYDKILPNEIKKYAKKFDVKVEAKPITIPRSGEEWFEKFTYTNTPDGILIMDPEGYTEEVLDSDTPMEDVRARLRELNEERFGADEKDVLGFDMTDALKAEALAGQPMFAPVQGKKGKPDIAGENREGVIVGARPGEGGWKVNRPDVAPPPISHPASKAPRVENIAAAMAKIFKSKKFNDFIAEAFGIKGIDVYATLGSFLGKPEPSFVIHGDGLTFEQADALSRFLGVMFAQDAMFVTQPVTSGGNGVALYIGKGKRLTKAQIEAVRDAAMKVGLDYTTTVDGTAFKFFPEDSNKLDEFYEKVATVATAAKLGTPQQITVRTEYYGSEDYLSGDAGSAEREAWIQESTDGTPGLFGRAVDGVLVPYARAVAAEGYRFSPDRFAHKFGLTDAQRDTIREALRAKRGKSISTAGILKGDEKIEINGTGRVVRGTATATVADVLWGLQNRAATVGQIEPGDHSKQAERVISDVIADEVAHHVSRPEGKSAIGWYDASLKKAKELYAKVFPEIATDADRNLFFDAILGIASQGNTVVDNARYTGRVYHLVTREGMSLKEAVAALKGSFGEQSVAIETNMLKLAALLEQNGYDTMRELFNTTMTVGEWNAKLRADKNLHVNGSPLQMAGAARQTVTGWMVFGPKIGSFINNLHGDYSTLTADLWFTRTWNRILGFAFLHAPQTEADKYQAFKDALVAEASMDNTPRKVAKNGKKTFWQHGNDLNNPNAPAELQFTEGELDQLMADPDRMLELASLLHDRFKNGDKFAEGESGRGYSTKSDLRRAAKNWIEHRDNTVEAPRTDNERAFQQQVAEAAQRKIKRKTGLDISIADIQAALWYHEKELFEFLGAGSTKSAPADYADAAAIFEETYNSGKLFDVKGKPIKGREHDYTQFTEDSGPQFSPRANVAGGEGVRGVAEGSSYGTGIEGSVAVEATHYSREERSELDSSQYGSGRPGAERGRLSRPDADPAVRNRVFFYVDEGNGVDPETGVGGTPHNVSLENLYPARQDPLGFRAAAAAKFPSDYDARANFFESEVVKAGFDGLYDYGAFGKQGVAVLLGNHKVPVAPGVATGPAQRAPEKTSQETQADALAASSLPGGRMRASAWINKIAGTEFDTAANRAALEARGGDLLYRSDLAELFAAKPEAKPEAKPRRMSDEQTRNAKVEALRAKLGWPEGSLVQKAPGDRLLVQAVRAVSRILGLEIIFVDTPNAEHEFNGVINPSDPNTLFLNVKGDAPMLSIIGHEFIHTLASTNRALFAKVGAALLKANGVSKADVAEYKKWVNASRTKLGQKPIDDAKAMEEMIADFSGQTWNSKEFWGALADSNPSVFKQVADGFMNIINKLLSGIRSNQTLRGSEYMRDVETTRDLLVGMMNELEAKGEQAGAETDPDFLPADQGTGGSVDGFSISDVDAYADATLEFSPRQKPDPEKTFKAYKLFNAKGGELFPLYINADQPTPIGEWLDADIGDNENSKIGKLAKRPGWHMGDSPAATHIGGKAKGSKVPTFRKPNQVWAEVSVAADRDWQTEANKRARTYKSGPRKGEIVPSSAEIRGEIPEDGFYRYKTNPNMQGSWIIGGAIKLERILSDEEVASINTEAGVQDLPRKAPLDTAALGFGEDDVAFAPLQTTDELDDLGELSWKTKTFTAIYDKYQSIIDTQKAVNKKYGQVTEDQDVNQAVTVHPGRLRARLDEFKDVYIEPLKRAIEESGMRPKDIGEFLLARHAREANAVLKARFPNRANNDRLSGMTDAQADRVLARYRGNATAQRLGSLIDSINTSRVNLMVRDGLMTQAEADAWSTNYSHYVPLNREEALDAMPSSGRGFDVGRKKASRLRGGSTKAVDTENMLARVLAQYEATLAWSEKNEVAKTFYNMAKNNPAPNLWVTDEVPTSPFLKADGTGTYRPNHMAPNVITAKIDGETKYITLEDSNPYAKKILEAMQNLDTNESGILTQSLLTVNRYLAAINTSLSPEFVISNLIRDWQTAAYNLTDTELRDMKAKVLFNAGSAIKGIHNALRGDNSSEWAGYYRRFAKAGGMTGWIQSYDGVGDRMKSLQRDIKYGNMAGIKQAKATFEAISDYNTIIENGVRLAAFRAAVDSGMSEAKAAAIAKELTVNFNRRGTWSLTMNALYLFSKASVNGSGRILIAAMNPKNKMLHAMLASTVVFAAGLEILMQAMDDDDEYKLIDDSVKDRNLVIMDPFGFADAGYYKIPLPWGYNVFHVLGQEIGKGIMSAAGENPSWSAGEAAARTALSMLHAFNPIQDGSFLQTLSPTILDPITRSQENKNWHGGSLYPDFNAHQADYKKYFRNAREESVALAKLMHDMTLDDATQKAILDVSPATLDMVYDFYTGSLGRVVADSASLAKVVVTGGEIPEARKLPMLRRVYGNLSDSDKQRVFYNRFDEMLYINQALTDTPDSEKRDLYESIGVRKDMLGMTKLAKKQLSNLSKQRREAEKRGNDEAVKKIEARRLEVMNRFTTRYNKIVHGI